MVLAAVRSRNAVGSESCTPVVGPNQPGLQARTPPSPDTPRSGPTIAKWRKGIGRDMLIWRLSEFPSCAAAHMTILHGNK
jgi:hypothetical protein